MGYGAYLLDIEGTTTPIDFVTRTLFPFARERMEDFLATADFDSDPELSAALLALRQDHNSDVEGGQNPPSLDSAFESLRLLVGGGEKAFEGTPAFVNLPHPDSFLQYIYWLMNRDRKSTGLKIIQGKIWEEGYTKGDLKGEVYADVLPAIRRWRSAGAKIFVFSSGSVLAQKLLFRHLPEGDATSLLDGYFDTTTGPKREAGSYSKIAATIGLDPNRILFLSDVAEEIAAAREAGMEGLLVQREAPTRANDVVTTFDGIS